MTPVTLVAAFQTTRDRLKLLGQAAVTTSAATFDYVVPQADVYPQIDFLIMRVSRQLTATAQQKYTMNLRMIVHTAEFQQGYEGEAQIYAQWTILPTALEYFEHHSAFKVNATDAQISYFDPINSAISDMAIQINGQLIDLVITFNLVFMTNFTRDC